MIMLLRWITRIGGLIAFVMGLMISRSPVLETHMIVGTIVAAALAIVAAWAIAKGARVPAALAGLIWAAATVYVGRMQMGWMTGNSHWVIEVIHAALGLGAIGMVEMLAAGITKRSA
jgi:hypothetical protein